MMASETCAWSWTVALPPGQSLGRCSHDGPARKAAPFTLAQQGRRKPGKPPLAASQKANHSDHCFSKKLWWLQNKLSISEADKVADAWKAKRDPEPNKSLCLKAEPKEAQ